MQKFPKKFYGWKVSDGKLYYFKPNPIIDLIIPDLDEWKLVLFCEKRDETFPEIHSDPQAGHLGQNLF